VDVPPDQATGHRGKYKKHLVGELPVWYDGTLQKKTPFTNKVRIMLAQTHLPFKLKKSADSFTPTHHDAGSRPSPANFS